MMDAPCSVARPARITILDDHALFAESLALALETEGHLAQRVDLTGRCVTLATALAAVLRSVPRIVLLDPALSRIGDGSRLVAPLAASGAAVIILTESGDRALWGEWVRHGAKAVLPKSCPLTDVLRVVDRVRDGLPLMSERERAALVDVNVRKEAEERQTRARLARLTPRESEVLAALMQGAQIHDIARACFVSESTVRSQVKSILAKLEMHSQLAAVAAASKAGWRPAKDQEHLPGSVRRGHARTSRRG